ncbi:MAG: hypothetical protein Q7R40_05365 [Phaeospirillum sp.]|nr:hypothetical protein [Phaeospirillum sp.]
MSVPDVIRAEVRDYLWAEADRLYWSTLSAGEKARWYGIWTESEAVGRRLAPFLDPRKIRVYIKDTLLKSYTRERMADVGPVMRLLGLPPEEEAVREFIKPHGRLFADGRLVAWSKAVDWKLTLMTIHERAFTIHGARAYGVALLEAATKHPDESTRAVVNEAARRLSVERLVWID